ncbi:MAG: DUF4131 domain-containing protein [Streptosporangiales bacterium]|nr:DUF4131 domain-containing protein [Streptosporangiales bacterium]
MSTTRGLGVVPSQVPDLRLGGAAVAGWLVALGLLGTSAGTAIAVSIVGVIVTVATRVLLRSRPRLRWSVPAVLACATAAAACTAAHLAVLGSGPIPRWAAAGSSVHAELVVSGDPMLVKEKPAASWQRRSVTVRASLRRVARQGDAYTGRQPVLVITSEPGWRRLTPGQRLRVTGTLARPLDDGTFAAVLYARSPPRPVGRPPPVQRVAAGLRAGLRDAVGVLPGEARGLIPGLVVGDTSLLSTRLEDEFRRTGLTHLLAVSGSNLAIVTGAIVLAGRWLVLSPRLLAGLAAGGIIGFVVLARPEPSVLRAAVMGGIGLLALGYGRPRRSLPALFTAVLVLVYADPALARSFGFALSVFATFGLIVLAPPWRDWLVARGVPRLLAEAIAVPAAAQAMCGPVIVLLAGQVNVLAVLANLLAAPAVAPITVLGVVVTLVHPVLPGVAELLAWCAWLPAWWVVQVARNAAAVPWAAVDWHGGVLGAVGLAALTVAVFVLAPHRMVRALVAAALVGALTVVGTVHLVAPAWPPKGWRVVACDVGQGDGLVLRVADGSAVVVDTGPESAPIRTCLDRLRIRQVPLVLVSHLHADHVAGLAGVLAGRSVGTVVTTPLGHPQEQWRQLRRSTARADVELHRATAGTGWQLPGLRLQVLWPEPGVVGVDSAGENDASLVVRASWPGLTMLLTGDIEPDAQRRLRAAGVELRADVLKVPHHGSARQDPGFLTATRSRVAVISAGADNAYGHPAARTLRSLRLRRMRVLRTDRGGDVAVVRTSSGQLAVVTRGGTAAAADP